MTTYQQINVLTQANVGTPGPLPAALEGLSEASLANLAAALDPAQLADPTIAAYAQSGFKRVADPAPDPRWITLYQFFQRFTAAERQAIEASTDAAVKDFLQVLNTLPTSGPSLCLDDPNTQAGVNYLEQTAKLIASGRAAQILA